MAMLNASVVITPPANLSSTQRRSVETQEFYRWYWRLFYKWRKILIVSIPEPRELTTRISEDTVLLNDEQCIQGM